MRRALLLAVAVAAGCSRSGPAAPEARLLASPDLPAHVVEDAAGHFGVARVVPVARAEDAEIAWVSDPTEALALGDRLVPGSAPDPADVAARWKDPRGRFAPLGARARVLLVAPRAALPFRPANLRDLADPRLAGRVALVPLGRGAGPVTVAALSLTYGDASVARFLDLVARGHPQLVGSDAEVRARVASGAAAVGLAGSIDGAAGAASAASLEVVYPDQAGRGAVVLPTAVALLAGAGDGARRLSAWLAQPEAERIVVARAPGILPLRADVPVPIGVEPASGLAAPALDWDRLAEEELRIAPALARWPEGDRRGR
jgi:iron(III) transport system substrate-binding protein